MYERYYACNSYINRRVSIQTYGGVSHEGVIVRVDHQNVYLDTTVIKVGAPAVVSSKKLKTSAFGVGGSQAILTLALFDLLAIALLV